MPVCAIQGPSGVQLRQMQPGEQCAGVVLLQQSDVPPNPFVLSYEQGAAVSAAVAGVWLAAWAWRAVYRVLDQRDS